MNHKAFIIPVTRENIGLLKNIRHEVDGYNSILPPEKFAREIKRYESGGAHHAFLMMDDKKVIGYIEVDLTEDYVPKGADEELCKQLQGYAHIARIGLLHTYKRRGLGSRLLEIAEQYVRENGATTVWLDYLPGNEELVPFYESAGYTTFLDFKDGDKERIRRIAVKQLKY